MPKKLLLADDSVVIQKLVGLSFANEDVELVTTDNGDDALAEARQQRPDIVLADVVMPGMTGYEVCAAIKEDPELRDIPVLLLTGTFEAFDEERARQVGSDGHITKPFEAQALVDRVKELFAAGANADTSLTTATSPAESSAVFDFFDEEAVNDEAEIASPDLDISSETRSNISPNVSENISAPLAESWSPPIADGLEMMPGDSSPNAATLSDAFEIGSDALPPLDDADLMGDFPDLDDDLEIAGGDQTMALMPHERAVNPPASDPQDAQTVTNLGFDDLDASHASDPLAPATDLDPQLTPPPLPQDDGLIDMEPATKTPGGSLTTVIMSNGDSSSDGIAFGSVPGVDAPSDSSASLNASTGADGFFGDSPAALAKPERAGNSSDAFDFAAESAASLTSTEAELPAAPGASGYDISSSDLGDPFAAPIAPPPSESLADDDFSDNLSDSLSDSYSDPYAEPIAEPIAEATPALEANEALFAEPAPDQDSELDPEPSGALPDISPVMRDRIHETIERVAWEAFSDLSETIVKQAIDRVEKIAWEVVPQMAETLIKEEIRRMKGEDED